MAMLKSKFALFDYLRFDHIQKVEKLQLKKLLIIDAIFTPTFLINSILARFSIFSDLARVDRLLVLTLRNLIYELGYNTTQQHLQESCNYPNYVRSLADSHYHRRYQMPFAFPPLLRGNT